MAELQITKENVENQVVGATVPVLLDFWATWCGPCRMLAPILGEIAEAYDGKVLVGKVNVDEQPELANAFQISAIPTLVLMKDGKAVKTLVGYHPKEELVQLLDE